MVALAAAGEQELSELLACGLNVFIDGLASLLSQFESNRLTRLSLTNSRALDCISVRCNVLDLQGDNIATAQLASIATLNMANSRS
jgi:hypothetical protein